jgi:peroxiredoxin-like protein
MTESHGTFPVSIRWQEGRRGRAESPDGTPGLEVASPPSFGGPGGVWTPEHLFVLAATSCWMTTFLAVAELSRLDFAAVEADGEGTLERAEDRRYRVAAIRLRPRVTVLREADRERALRLIEKAESACLIARSMTTPVELVPEVRVAPEGAAS